MWKKIDGMGGSSGGSKRCRKQEERCISYKVTLAPFVAELRGYFSSAADLADSDKKKYYTCQASHLSISISLRPSFLYKLSPPKRSAKGERTFFCQQ